MHLLTKYLQILVFFHSTGVFSGLISTRCTHWCTPYFGPPICCSGDIGFQPHPNAYYNSIDFTVSKSLLSCPMRTCNALTLRHLQHCNHDSDCPETEICCSHPCENTRNICLTGIYHHRKLHYDVY